VGRLTFGKRKRLVSNRQFRVILARGKRVGDRLLTLYMAENSCGFPRLGVSVSKSCGNAVVRNRVKRLLREVFRQSQNEIPERFDYLLMTSRQWSTRSNKPNGTSQAAREPTFEQMRASFLALVKIVEGRTQNKDVRMFEVTDNS
jgi:ribonuclease P protein component